MLSAEAKRVLESLGVTHTSIEPGGFYHGLTPGGYTDVATGIHIPGPKVQFKNEHSREIVAFKEIPEPYQIPHLHAVMEKDEKSNLVKEVFRDFNAMDNYRIHEGLLNALQTGVIRFVSEQEMKEKYPATWAKKEDKIIWRDASNKPAKTNWELLDEAEQNDSYARNVMPEDHSVERAAAISNHVKATQQAILGGKLPPPLPQK